MKKILLPATLFAAILFSACSSKKEESTRDMVFLNDSLYRNSVNTDTAAFVEEVAEEAAPYVASRPAPVSRPVAQKSRTVRNKRQPVYEPAPVVVNPVETPSPAPQTTPATGTGTETAAGSGTSTGAEAETAPKKTGMSKGAKGAIIGGVGGAVAGAVLGKNGKGAVIGGVIGAAGGYILGRKKDKADGRVGNYQDSINQ